MSRRESQARGERFREQAERFERPLFVYAHHDDEIATAGLLQLLAERCRVVWVTNSDGLYFESDLSPERYGALRQAEGLRSLACAGVASERASCLGYSEVEIYRRLAALHAGRASAAEVAGPFAEMRRRIHELCQQFQPDAVFTLAWQGGNPEHDLVHFFTAQAVARLGEGSGRRPEFFHMPAYEYTILLAMRFHPLYRGERLRLVLRPRELDTKLRMIGCYPSQRRLFGDFRRVIRWLVRPWGLVSGGPTTIEQFLQEEEFGPVPAGLDYRRKPHLWDFFTYMFDDFQGTPVTFTGSLRPLVEYFLDRPL